MSILKSVSIQFHQISARVITQIREPLFLNGAYILGVSILPAIVGFAFWWIATIYFTPAEIGQASAVISAVILISTISMLGIGNGIIRFLPGSNNSQLFLNSVYTFILFISILACSIFLIGLQVWSPSLRFIRDNHLILFVFTLMVIATAVGGTVRTTFVARRQAKYALLYTFLVQGGRAVLLFAVISLGVAGLVVSIGLPIIIAGILILVIYLPKVEPGYRYRLKISWTELAPILPYSIGNFFSDMLPKLAATLLPLLILESLGAALTGYAYIALLIGGLLLSPGLALARSAFAEGANSPREIVPILARAGLPGLSITLLLAGFTITFAPWILAIFGINYALEASSLLRWLAAAAPLILIANLYYTYLQLTKQISRLILVGCLVVGFSLGLSALLLPEIGISAVGIALLAVNSLVALYCGFKLIKNPYAREEIRTLVLSIVGSQN